MQQVIRGLSETEASSRRAQGKGNNIKLQTSRSYTDILRQNVFTFINIVLFAIGAILVSIGRVTDAVTSVGLIFLNIIIGVYQEARAKRQLDQIALLTRPRASVLRDGVEKQVDPSEVVLGDVLVARPGDQIIVDGTVIGDGKMDVDESLLTGESDLISKNAGDTVMSGSFCVNGSAMYEATRVGVESYANQLTASARAYRIQKTPLQRDVEFTLRLLMLLAIFLGFLLLMAALLYATPVMRGVQMAAVVAGLVPNGLFFMVIIAYAMGALRIAGQGALIQQSNSVESLSNVTVLCMDKTGTLTANRILFNDIEPLNMEKEALRKTLADFASSASVTNKTGEAIIKALGGTKRTVVDEVPFSSARKWSALSINDGDLCGVYVLGATEMLQPYLQAGGSFAEQLKTWSDTGLRVLIFAHHPDPVVLHNADGQPTLPHDLIPLGLISFSDELRENVAQTIKQFADAAIHLKVISGDNPHTVAALAKQAGLPGDLEVVSGTELDSMTDTEIESAAERCTIFGRITPQQKERLVDALRRRGHYVAMMGDGVNDVLSLKKANLGIAMNSGSAATRGVADIILINDSFAALPPAFLEGQRIINGMQDILRLFLTRAMTVALLILALAVIGVGFPFVPTHVSLLTLLTVGIPTLALAGWARPAKLKRGLLRSVINFVFPAAISVFLFGMMLYTFYFIQVSTNVMTIDVQPEDITAFQEMAKIDYELSTQRAYAVEVAGIISRTVLTTFTVLTGLILVIFVEPPHPFFVGGDELSPDKRPTYLAFGLFLAFIGIMVFAPSRNFFELVLLGLDDYLIIAGVVLIWMLVLRRAYQHRWFPRFLNLDA
jgi:cation-transporting P-type ATPase E